MQQRLALCGRGVMLAFGASLRAQSLVPAMQIKGFYGADADRALPLYGIGAGSALPNDPVLGSSAAQRLTDSSFRCGAVITAARHAVAELRSSGRILPASVVNVRRLGRGGSGAEKSTMRSL